MRVQASDTASSRTIATYSRRIESGAIVSIPSIRVQRTLGSINFQRIIHSCDPAVLSSPDLCWEATAALTSISTAHKLRRGVSGGEWDNAPVFWRISTGRLACTNNLTVNLGLRYEAHTPWVEIHNHR